MWRYWVPSFLVDAADSQQPGVFVKTGRVRVSDDENEVVIIANEKVELKHGELEVGIIDNPQQYFGQDKLMMIFDNAPISDVVKEIEQKNRNTDRTRQGTGKESGDYPDRSC